MGYFVFCLKMVMFLVKGLADSLSKMTSEGSCCVVLLKGFGVLEQGLGFLGAGCVVFVGWLDVLLAGGGVLFYGVGVFFG